MEDMEDGEILEDESVTEDQPSSVLNSELDTKPANPELNVKPVISEFNVKPPPLFRKLYTKAELMSLEMQNQADHLDRYGRVPSFNDRRRSTEDRYHTQEEQGRFNGEFPPHPGAGYYNYGLENMNAMTVNNSELDQDLGYRDADETDLDNPYLMQQELHRGIDDSRLYMGMGPPSPGNELSADGLPARDLYKHRACAEEEEDPGMYYSKNSLHENNYVNPKLEVCRSYLNDFCAQRERCKYMHEDFPCRNYHTVGYTCNAGKNCKFSHSKLNDLQRTALSLFVDAYNPPEEDFTRYTNEMEKPHRNDIKPRIPSLLEIKVPVPPAFLGKNEPYIFDMSDDENGDEFGGSDYQDRKPPEEERSSPLADDQNLEELVREKQSFLRDLKEMDREEKRRKRKHSSETKKYKKHHGEKPKKSKHQSEEETSERKHKKKHSHKKHKESRKLTENYSIENEVKNEEEMIVAIESNSTEDSAPEESTSNDSGCSSSIKTKHVSNDDRSHQDEAFLRLPKRTQELYLRIKQNQKDADRSPMKVQNDVQESDDEQNTENINWYSSDEEKEKEENNPNAALDTILKTIRSSISSSTKESDSNEESSENLPMNQKAPDDEDSTSSSVINLDSAKLASINISPEITELLSKIYANDSTIFGSKDTGSSSQIPNSTTESSIENMSSSQVKNSHKFETMSSAYSSEFLSKPVDLDVPTAGKPLDILKLPFKPVPVHCAANEIDASITSHPPMVFKPVLIEPVPKLDYSAMSDIKKMFPKDPRFQPRSPPPHSNRIHLGPFSAPNEDPRMMSQGRSYSQPEIDYRDPRIHMQHGFIFPPEMMMPPPPHMMRPMMPMMPLTLPPPPGMPPLRPPFEMPPFEIPSMMPMRPPMDSSQWEAPRMSKEDPRLKYRGTNNVY